MTVVERAHVVLHEPNLAQRRSAQFKGWESGHCHERSPTSRHEAPLAPSFARRRDCGRPTIGTLELVATRQTQSRCLALFHESEVEPHTPGTLSLQSPLRADELVSPRAGILEPIFSAPQNSCPDGAGMVLRRHGTVTAPLPGRPPPLRTCWQHPSPLVPLVLRWAPA